MKKKKLETVRANVEIAATEVSDAASDLDKLLREIKTSPRAEKTTVSKVVEDAFSRLKTARVALSDVQKVLEDDEDS